MSLNSLKKSIPQKYLRQLSTQTFIADGNCLLTARITLALYKSGITGLGTLTGELRKPDMDLFFPETYNFFRGDRGSLVYSRFRKLLNIIT